MMKTSERLYRRTNVLNPNNAYMYLIIFPKDYFDQDLKTKLLGYELKVQYKK